MLIMLYNILAVEIIPSLVIYHTLQSHTHLVTPLVYLSHIKLVPFFVPRQLCRVSNYWFEGSI